jgi:hypothetical protein
MGGVVPCWNQKVSIVAGPRPIFTPATLEVPELVVFRQQSVRQYAVATPAVFRVYTSISPYHVCFLFIKLK